MAGQDLWTPGQTVESHDAAVHRALSLGRGGAADEDREVISEMRKNRKVNARRVTGGTGSPSVSLATGRPHDPMFYWKQNNLPLDFDKPEELAKVKDWCRLLYLTHPTIASAIDIFSKYPLTGMELTCKDEQITDFYTSLFFDQLEYEDFMVDIGREYWTVGEVFPLGSFNELLGVWEDEELINPNDVEVIRSPFLREPRFEMRLPPSLREILKNRDPKWEYDALMRSYPELNNFLDDEKRMPISNVLMRHIKFKADSFHPRGLPILMRAFRSILQEEMLNAAQDAVADRLYMPLVIAKLGASATELGTTSPWIPTDDDVAGFEEALDTALAADFRVLTTNFATDVGTVLGRESVPDFDADFERLIDRQLMAFGLSKTMLTGASQGETYAADALNRDQVSQNLTGFQRLVKKHFRERALVVAEAQEHYDYEVRGGKRYPIMEEVLEVDEDGNQRIVEQPKLLVPDMTIKAMNMQDERELRQFVEAAVAAGVPISMKTRLVNVPVDLKKEIEIAADEQIEMALEAQRVRKRTYEALRDERLPIPADLLEDFAPKAADGTGKEQPGAEEVVMPTLGNSVPAPTLALAPTAEDVAAAADAANAATDGQGAGVDSPTVVQMLPRNRILEPGRTRPPESDEQRARMPKPAVRTAAVGEEVTGVLVGEHIDFESPPGPLTRGPSHVGMRRHAKVDKDTPLPEDVEYGHPSQRR